MRRKGRRKAVGAGPGLQPRPSVPPFHEPYPGPGSDGRRRGHSDGGRCVGGKREVQFETAAAKPPGNSRFSANRVELGFDPMDRRPVGVRSRRRRTRHNPEPPVTGAFRVDAGQHPEHPLGDGAECVVAEGIHGRRVKAFVLGVAVPALPHRRGSVLHLVSPRREFAALKEADGQIVIPRRAENRQQGIGSQETGGHPVVVAGDELRQMPGRGRAETLRNQTERQRQGIGGLGAGAQAASGFEVVLLKHGGDAGEQLLVSFALGGFPDGGCHLRHQAGRVSEVGGVDELNGSRAAQGKPVAPRVGVVHAAEAGAAPPAELHEAGHRAPVPFDQPRVAVRFPDLVRHNHPGVHPRRAVGCLLPMLHRIGRVIGESAVVTLRFRQVVQPLGEECGGVGMECRRAAVDLGVARPAQPFVALRAIRGDLDKVRALRPDDVAVKLVRHLVRGRERTRKWRIGMDHDSGHRIQGRLAARIAGDFDVPESVIGEARCPRLHSGAAQDVGVGSPSLAQVLGHQTAVRIDHFPEPESHPRTRRAGDLQPRDAGEVLPQVEDERAPGRTQHADRPDFLDGADIGRRVGLHPERRGEPEFDLAAAGPVVEDRPGGPVGARGDSLLPAAVVEGGFAPAGHLAPRVVGLAHQQVGFQGRAGGALPGRVAGDGAPRAAGKLQYQLEQQRRRLAVKIPARAVGSVARQQGVADIAGVPAVGEDGADGVGAVPQQGRNVPGAVIGALAVVRPAG
mgnify:CR=1 FL=1